MKRAISVFILASLLLCVFNACGESDDELSYMVSLECNSEDGYSWIFEEEKQGVIREQKSDIIKDGDSKEFEVFFFEAVGEGETAVTFWYTPDGDKNSAEIICEYSFKVDSDFNIVGEETSYEIIDRTVKITDKNEAIQYVTDKIGLIDKATGKENIFVFERVIKENGKKQYVIKIYKTVKMSDGKTALVFSKTVAVSPDGTITDIELDDINTEDITLSEKA